MSSLHLFQFSAGSIGTGALAALSSSFTSSNFDQLNSGGTGFSESSSSGTGFSGASNSGIGFSGASTRGGSSTGSFSGTSARQTASGGGRTGGSSASGGGRAAAPGVQSIPGGVDFTKAVRTDDGRLCVIKQESVETVAKVPTYIIRDIQL